MRSRVLWVVVVLLVPTGILPTGIPPGTSGAEGRRFEVELEGGPVWQSRNEVQIPNTSEGTRFSAVDLIGKGPWPSVRLYLTYDLSPKHALRLLLAPLAFTETGILGSAVSFAGESYEPGVPTEATYKFNSWRATYRYRLWGSERWRLHIGFTAKIRDAKIELGQEGKSSRKTDLGFVPLLHLAADCRLAQHWHLRLDLDALAGGPGRAEDLGINLGYDLTERWRISAGYRTVEGGADVEEVYNFAWLHYAVLSAICRF